MGLDLIIMMKILLQRQRICRDLAEITMCYKTEFTCWRWYFGNSEDIVQVSSQHDDNLLLGTSSLREEASNNYYYFTFDECQQM